MEFNTSRVAQLAGLSGSRKKATGILSEARQISGLDNDLDLDPVTEAKLRQAIREELRAILSENEESNREADADVTRAQGSKSVSQAMGFAGPGFSSSPRQNRTSARGPGGSHGFGGPGFM